MKLAARLTMGIGGLVYLIALFLPYGLDETLWHDRTRYPLLLLLLALTVIACSVVSFAIDLPVLVVISAALSVFLLGESLPLVYVSYSEFQVGFWLMNVAALAMTVGGGLMVAAIWPSRAWKSTTGIATSGETTAASAPRSGSGSPQGSQGRAVAPPGWYPDPAGLATQRYWSGSEWTAESR